jgi:hypothetical protein
MPGNWSWLTSVAPGTIWDLQNAGTPIQLPGLYRAYECERSVKIFALFSLRSAFQTLPRAIAVPVFCKSDSRNKTLIGFGSISKTGNTGNRASLPPRRASQDQNAGNQGLGATYSGLSGPESREIRPGRGRRRPALPVKVGPWASRD